MNDKVYALLAQSSLQGGVEFEFPRQRFRRARVGFHIEVDVTAAQVIPNARPEQQGLRILAEVALHFFAYGPPLHIGKSHFGRPVSDGRLRILLTLEFKPFEKEQGRDGPCSEDVRSDG